MRRTIFSDEHEHFRAEFRRFALREIVPHLPEWNARGRSDKAAWRKMGESGFLGANASEEYGGAGADFLYDAIVMEELAYLRAHALKASLHTDICMPYLASYGSEAQKRKYLTRAITGECKRAKLTTVILPKRNKKDLEDIPKHLLEGLHLAFVETMDDVLKVGLRKASPAKSMVRSAANGHGRKRRAQPPAVAPAGRVNRPRPRSIAPSVSIRPRLTH